MFKRVRAQVRESTNRFQTPWTGSSITGDFYFRLPEPEPEAVPAALPDVVFWNAIENSSNPGDYETFIEEHPDSVLVPLARKRIAAHDQAGRRACGGREPGIARGRPERLRAAAGCDLLLPLLVEP